MLTSDITDARSVIASLLSSVTISQMTIQDAYMAEACFTLFTSSLLVADSNIKSTFVLFIASYHDIFVMIGVCRH
jgi:hypothetical protein